ncbi:dual specificity protein phosphatase PHS1-like [Arachis stenosperma]|uniref:dual specificity protein phosphatase PHS1-like n=1 Tax=Arachis stenosperma TaxID=217475 RepID=UPI0025AC81D2|nr:dual specificity protein phosphatase PHS1-like [Arachis stenosperma]
MARQNIAHCRINENFNELHLNGKLKQEIITDHTILSSSDNIDTTKGLHILPTKHGSSTLLNQADSQFPDLFTYKNFYVSRLIMSHPTVSDNEDCNISSIFEEACDFIDYVEQIGQRVLVHCFEGRSRSVFWKFTLLEAWNTLKRVHRRAQPNDGFAKILQELDKKLNGKVSMEWQQRKPTMQVCPSAARMPD